MKVENIGNTFLITANSEELRLIKLSIQNSITQMRCVDSSILGSKLENQDEATYNKLSKIFKTLSKEV